MKRRFLAMGSALVFSLGFSSPSFAASNQEMVNLCLLAMNTDASISDTASYRLKSIKGGGVKRIKFKSTGKNAGQDVVCRISRGEVVSIEKA